MSLHLPHIDRKIARFDSELQRIDRLATARIEGGPPGSRGATVRAKQIANLAIALVIVALGTIGLGIVLNGIGALGLASALVTAVLVTLYFLMPEREKPIVAYSEEMTNSAVVQRLDSLLVQKRVALPAPAGREIDQISKQLPLLEARLADTAVLDPLAQDARRLMGKHLPELIARYERVPANYRAERDGEGLTVDERLVQGLGAAKTALDELGRKLAHEDLSAFETQGRFIESRYKDGEEALKAE